MSPATLVHARPLLACLLFGSGGLAFPAMVLAHAIVVESVPTHDARLETSPARILLRFNTKIERGLCRVRLEGPNGEIETPLVSSESPDRLEASVPALDPGTYLLRYRTFAVDGHVTEGVLRFHIGRDPAHP